MREANDDARHCRGKRRQASPDGRADETLPGTTAVSTSRYDGNIRTGPRNVPLIPCDPPSPSDSSLCEQKYTVNHAAPTGDAPRQRTHC